MTTHTPTIDDLRAELSAAEREIEEAERSLGLAALGGASVGAAEKRLAVARLRPESIRAAIAELERRAETEEAEARVAAAADSRRQVYAWIAEYVSRIEALLEAQQAVKAAGEYVKALGVANRVFRAKGRYFDERETDLDIGLVDSVPDFPTGQRGRPVEFGKHVTAEQCQRLRARAEQLAAEDEAAER